MARISNDCDKYTSLGCLDTIADQLEEEGLVRPCVREECDHYHCTAGINLARVIERWNEITEEREAWSD